MIECFSRIVSDSAESARMESPRVSSLDVMKCFAAFCVVWIHFGNEWLNPIVRCAVPIFFVITGYYYPVMVEKKIFWKHIRKLLMMMLCASTLYGLYDLQYQIRHDSFNDWLSNVFSLRIIVEKIVYDCDLFGPHLWYFYAVLYDLVIFYFADKWNLTRYLRYVVPFLLLCFFIGNFAHRGSRVVELRNFLFFGLPCMMIGRLVREKKDSVFCFLGKKQYLWVYTLTFLFLIVIEVIVCHKLFEDTGDREMFVFTLPLVLPYFYWALYHPKFGERSFWAIIGRKYSAYIYIFHVLADQFLLHVVNRKDSLLAEVIYPFLVFGLSLCMAWLLVRFLQRFNIRF